MDDFVFYSIELILFFVTLGPVFKVFLLIDVTKIFKVYKVFEIRIFVVFSAVIFNYLFVHSIVSLMKLMNEIFG